MLFLKGKSKITSHKGTTPDHIPGKIALDTEEVYVVSHCYTQTLKWVLKDKVADGESTNRGEAIPCIVETTKGVFTQETIDPAFPNPEILRAYPIKKTFVKQFVPTKTKVEEKEN